MTAAVAKGFLTYRGLAVRLEIQRDRLEYAHGKDLAQELIISTLRQFKEARAEVSV
jgi:hypothetical protein